MSGFDFEFDLSDKSILPESNIVIKGKEDIQVKRINKISELSIEQKTKINNVLWYNKEISNSALIEVFITEFGLSEIIANNLVHIHRLSYLEDKGYYTIFDREKKVSTFTKKSMGFFNNKYKSI